MNPRDVPACHPCILFYEMIHQHGHIFAAVAQWRYGDRDDIQPVIKVLAKGVFSNLALEISISGCDHANVDRDFVSSANRTHAALL